MKLITVFTPTYNRSKTLTKCYESLLNQTSKNFLWQIVDDGSTDDTQDIVDSFISDNQIQIEYYKKSNGGKVSAINFSTRITKTPLWVCLDSDDFFLDSAIETYERLYPIIEHDERACGLFSLRSKDDGLPMQGKSIPRDLLYETQWNIRYKYGIAPEYVQVYKTSIIKNYQYPVIPEEKFFPLSYIQDQIDQKYYFYVFREPTMVCEYRDDGITKNHRAIVKKNPIGYTMFKRQQITTAPNMFFKIKACISYDTGCILSRTVGKIVTDSPAKLLTTLFAPLGYLDYLIRYKRYA